MIRLTNAEKKARKEDARYKLLDFSVKYFTKNKMLRNNKEYLDFHKTFPNKTNANKMHQVMGHLHLNYISYDNYSYIYKEMVKHGYDGPEPIRIRKKKVHRESLEAPLYIKESFQEDNKNALNDKRDGGFW